MPPPESTPPEAPAPPRLALLTVSAFSRYPEVLAWARAALESSFGPLGLTGEPFSFQHTKYYEKTMGTDLRKQLLAFRTLVAEDCLPDVKHRTIALEAELAARRQYPEPRPVNLDPGLLTLGKFLLATTKDQAHRIYLGRGIFAEVTLRYQAGAFQVWPWTYADYREPCVHDFLLRARDYYRQRLSEQHAPELFAS